jgi:hypothetical protein
MDFVDQHESEYLSVEQLAAAASVSEQIRREEDWSPQEWASAVQVNEQISARH